LLPGRAARADPAEPRLRHLEPARPAARRARGAHRDGVSRGRPRPRGVSVARKARRRRAQPRTIADDIQQTRPFPSRSDEAGVGLLLTADVVRRHGEAVLAPYGITLQQYNVLRILRGSRPDSLPTLEIAARMIEKAPGITRLLDRLERKGLVRRERCAADRRQILCAITEKGLRLLHALEAPLRSSVDPFNRLSEKDLEQLIRLLNALREAHR